MDKILILDFGGQSTQLIGRRIRQLGVYSEIVRGDARMDEMDLTTAKGIILSGSPYSVYEPGAPTVDRAHIRCRAFPSSGSATVCSA